MKKNKKLAKTIKLTKVLDHMIEWAFECGKILNEHLIHSYEKPLKVIDKGQQGLATEADLLSEAFVIKKIREHYPGHEILSEEDAFCREVKIEGVQKNQYLWLIDPLDGTNNFYNKVPFFCVSIALNKGNETLVGVVYNPLSGELFYALKDKGAWLYRHVGNREIHLKLKAKKNGPALKEAILSANMGGQSLKKGTLRHFPEVRAMRRLGSAALELSYVAAGMLDGYWEYGLRPWDLAAAGLICQEAGVKISGLKGEEFQPFSSSVLASQPGLYRELMALLSG